MLSSVRRLQFLHVTVTTTLSCGLSTWSDLPTDLKTVLPGWNVHCRQVSQGLELRIGVVPEEGQHWDDTVGMNADL